MEILERQQKYRNPDKNPDKIKKITKIEACFDLGSLPIVQ